MAYAELDPLFVQGLKLMHSKSKDSADQLRALLEDAIRQKHGDAKSLKNLVLEKEPTKKIKNDDRDEFTSAAEIKMEISSEVVSLDDDSDEFSLGILGDDLTCIICHSMDVTARNQLVECIECHNLYHQECHEPPVMDVNEVRSTWSCDNCVKVIAKPSAVSSSAKFFEKEGLATKLETTATYKKLDLEADLGSVVTSRIIKSTLETISSSSSKSQSSSVKVPAPKVNVVSADKRIQDMKKKAAAKLHDKRKHVK